MGYLSLILYVREGTSLEYDLLSEALPCEESKKSLCFCSRCKPVRVAQSVGYLTHKSEVLGLIPGLATYFNFSFRFFKKGSCQLLAKVCARSTG